MLDGTALPVGNYSDKNIGSTQNAHKADNIYSMELDLLKLRTHPIILRTILDTLYDRGNTTFKSNLPWSHQLEETRIYNAIVSAAKDQDRIKF